MSLKGLHILFNSNLISHSLVDNKYSKWLPSPNTHKPIVFEKCYRMFIFQFIYSHYQFLFSIQLDIHIWLIQNTFHFIIIDKLFKWKVIWSEMEMNSPVFWYSRTLVSELYNRESTSYSCCTIGMHWARISRGSVIPRTKIQDSVIHSLWSDACLT